MDIYHLVFDMGCFVSCLQGVLREVVLVMQKEVVEGELLRDCLEVGADDLEGLVRVARDLIFSSSSSSRSEL